MHKKNQELAKRNTELLEEISRLTDIHSDMLKESIKNKYYQTRAQNKLIIRIERQEIALKELLEDCINLKQTITNVEPNKEEQEPNTSVFQQTMKILDTICSTDEQTPSPSIKKTERKALEEKPLNKPTRKKRKSVSRR